MTAAVAPRPPCPARVPVILYRHDQANHCPRCQGSAWHVGRASAECGRCGEVLPFLSPRI